MSCEHLENKVRGSEREREHNGQKERELHLGKDLKDLKDPEHPQIGSNPRGRVLSDLPTFSTNPLLETTRPIHDIRLIRNIQVQLQKYFDPQAKICPEIIRNISLIISKHLLDEVIHQEQKN